MKVAKSLNCHLFCQHFFIKSIPEIFNFAKLQLHHNQPAEYIQK